MHNELFKETRIEEWFYNNKQTREIGNGKNGFNTNSGV